MRRVVQITKKVSQKRNFPQEPQLRDATKLTHVSLSGVVVPWTKSLESGGTSNYKLVCSSGVEYFVVADADWREVMSFYSWEEVNIIGLLDVANMALFPKRVFPKGPTGERENVIHLAAWKGKEILKKVAENVNELVFVPAALCAVMAL